MVYNRTLISDDMNLILYVRSQTQWHVLVLKYHDPLTLSLRIPGSTGYSENPF
jgi:hypothetical protein